MSPKKLAVARAGHFHAVRFYQDDDSLCHIVSDFLSEGLIARQPAIVIGTPAHRDGITARLRGLSHDVESLERSGHLVLLDAGEILAKIMVDGMADSRRFKGTMLDVIEAASRVEPDSTVRAYGEMVDVLWQAGMHTAAVRLEMLWNQLANSHRFSLLCGYSMGSFYKDAAYDDICRQHTHVVSAEGETGAIN